MKKYMLSLSILFTMLTSAYSSTLLPIGSDESYNIMGIDSAKEVNSNNNFVVFTLDTDDDEFKYIGIQLYNTRDDIKYFKDFRSLGVKFTCLNNSPGEINQRKLTISSDEGTMVQVVPICPELLKSLE